MARAARLDHRDRLARQGRLVDGGRGRTDHAVDRNDFAGPHQKPVADGDGGYRHLLDMVVDATMRLARRAIDQRAQIVLGAGNRDILEHVAAGIHQRDDRAGKRLAERQRRAHRDQCDRIDTEPARQKIPDDRDGKPGHHRCGRQRPEQIGEIRPVGEVGGNAGRQSRHRDRDQCPPQHAFIWHRPTCPVLMQFRSVCRRKCACRA